LETIASRGLKKVINKEILYELYINQKLGAKRISKILGCSKWTVLKYLKKYGIKTREPNQRWSDDEIRVIKEHYNAPKEVLMSLLPKRTWQSIYYKIRELNLKRRPIVYHRPARVKNLTMVQRAYIAGLIDGEGYISLCYRKRVRDTVTHNCLHPSVEISNTKKQLSIYCQKQKGKWNAAYRLHISAVNDVYELLKQITPFLIIKKKQAILLMQFCEIRLSSRLGDGFSQRELDIYKKLRKLNKRGV